MKKVNSIWFCPLVIVGLILMLISSCKKDDNNDNNNNNQKVPVLTTFAVSNIAQTTATSGGNVTSQGTSAVSARGVCWSTSSNPTTLDGHTTDGNGTGIFTSNLTGLTANTPYYVRAYATNGSGTAYGNLLNFTTLPGASETVTDIDGNVYHTVTIGTQVWMVENLKTTKYNDGTIIPYVTESLPWAHGALYYWYAVNTGKLCPTGWHVPSNTEWTTLVHFLGGETVAGGKMKSTGTIEASTGLWYSPNAGATNESGFTALPGGYRESGGPIYNVGFTGKWWSSSWQGQYDAYYLLMYHDASDLSINLKDRSYWFSVRCLRDL